MLVVAEQSKAFREHNNGVTFNNKPSRFFVCQLVKVLCIIFVCNSGSSIVYDLYILEDVCISNINVGNNRQSSSQTDSSDVNSLKASLLLNSSEVTSNIQLNGLPHLFVGFLNLAVRAKVGVYNLVCIENVLPNIEQSVCVSESEDDKGWIDTQDTFYVFNILFNVVCVKRSVSGVTHIAFPVQQIRMIVFSDNHGVSKEHLLNVRREVAKAKKKRQARSNFISDQVKIIVESKQSYQIKRIENLLEIRRELPAVLINVKIYKIITFNDIEMFENNQASIISQEIMQQSSLQQKKSKYILQNQKSSHLWCSIFRNFM